MQASEKTKRRVSRENNSVFSSGYEIVYKDSSLLYNCHVAPVEYMYTTQEIQTQLFSLKPALLSSPADKEEKTKK